MATIKITVLKRIYNEEFGGEVVPSGAQPCSRLSEGQEFITTCADRLPEGFCPWAWHDIHKYVLTLLMGGNLYWMKEPGTMITCCNDGVRPVVFRLERIEA
jgi:uncharacterized repeat protein (TIGR04076 family)